MVNATRGSWFDVLFFVVVERLLFVCKVVVDCWLTVGEASDGEYSR